MGPVSQQIYLCHNMKRIIAILVVVGIYLLVPHDSYAAITQRGTATSITGTSGSTAVVSKPTGVEQGDLMIAFTCSDTAGLNITITGWTAISTAITGNSGVTCRALYKVATGSEGSSYTFNYGSSNSKVAAIVAYYSSSTGGVIEYDTVTRTNLTSSSTTHTLNSITTSKANSMLLGLWGSDGNSGTYSNFTAPLEEIFDGNTTAVSQAMAAGIQVSAGASGAKSATTSVSDDGGGYLIALKELLYATASSPTATSVSGSTAVLGGTVNPNGQSTTALFRYGTSNTSCASLPSTTSSQSMGSSSLDQIMTGTTISNLAASDTYYYCIQTTTADGISYSSVASFSTITGCAPPNSGNMTINSSCAFSGGAYNGADLGTGTTNTAQITLNSGRTLTVNPNQTIAYGSIVKPGSTIIKFGGGVLKKGPLYVPDADGDLYPNAGGVQNTLGGAGYSRRSEVNNKFSSTDCNDENANIFQNQNAAIDLDQDGYGISAASSTCAGLQSTLSGRFYYNDESGAAGLLRSFDMLGSSDCLDSGAGAQYVYQNQNVASDEDQDGYATTTSTSQCVGGATSILGRSYYPSTSGNLDKVASPLATSDCAASDGTRWENKNMYVDNDGDQYSPNAGTTSVCSGDIAPPGYSNVNVARVVTAFSAGTSAGISDAYLNDSVNFPNPYAYRVSGTTVSRASITSGVLGAFSTTNQTAPPVSLRGTLISSSGSNHFIYGYRSSSCPSDGCQIYFAQIDSSGNVGSWTDSGQKMEPELQPFIVNINGVDYIYSINYVASTSCGGSNYCYYRIPINGANGSLGNRQLASTLAGSPASLPVREGAAVVGTINNKIYVYHIGGRRSGNEGAGLSYTMWKAEINSGTGEVGVFAASSYTLPVEDPAPQLRGSAVLVSSSGQPYIYYFSGTDAGCSQPVCGRIYRAVLNGSGNISSAGWVQQATLAPYGGATSFYLHTNGAFNIGNGYKSTFGLSGSTGTDSNDNNPLIYPGSP